VPIRQDLRRTRPFVILAVYTVQRVHASTIAESIAEQPVACLLGSRISPAYKRMACGCDPITPALELHSGRIGKVKVCPIL